MCGPQVVNTSGELRERQDVVSLLALYALYRRLCPPAVLPDAKLYKRLWAIQKEVPVVILHAKAIWFPPEFLLKYAPFDSQVKKLEPPDAEGEYDSFRPIPREG